MMDYTCPHWVTCAPREELEVVRIDATGVCTQGYGCPVTIIWSAPDRFTQGWDAWCLNGWCVPHTCRNSSFYSSATLNNPAHLKIDPTFHHHGLRHHGFTVAISWWAGHDKADMQLGEKGKRTVVDFRGVDVRVDDYRNGSVHVACPPRSHDYYVLRDGRMQPCQCISNRQHLNCQNRPATKQRLSFGAAHGTHNDTARRVVS